MSVHVIIVAGGLGVRMGATLPKQFLLLNNRPILQYTIEKFYKALPNSFIYLVLPKAYQEQWIDICTRFSFRIPHKVVDGGTERFYSVKNALENIKAETEEDFVLIHDGVRPLVSKQTILNTLKTAAEKGAAIPVIPLTDSIREITPKGSIHRNRKDFCLVQTPQCFRLKIIKQSYKVSYNPVFTDDASVVEYAGFKVELANGNKENIKITTPEDLIIAQAFLKKQKHDKEI